MPSMSALSTTRMPAAYDDNRRSRYRRAVRTIILSALLCAALAAPAGADSLSVTAGPDPAQDSTPVTVHVSGQTAAAQPTVAVYQQPAGQDCPADRTGASGPLVVREPVAGGAFAADYRTSFATGTVLLCAYLSDGDGPTLATAAHSFFVRPLRVQLSLGLPAKVERHEPFRGDVSYPGLPLTADTGLWVDVKPDDGRGCAATRAAEPADAVDLLTPARGGHTFTSSLPSYGRYLVCVWLIRHDGSALAGPVFATINVTHITGGRRFSGRTSQGLPIRFRRLGRTLYGMTYSVRCAGRVTRVRADPIALAHGRFRTPALRGRLDARTAHGTLIACGGRRLRWSAR